MVCCLYDVAKCHMKTIQKALERDKEEETMGERQSEREREERKGLTTEFVSHQ